MISFITPTHKLSYLKETYESLKKQNRQDFEWVIIPNGGVTVAEVEALLDMRNPFSADLTGADIGLTTATGTTAEIGNGPYLTYDAVNSCWRKNQIQIMQLPTALEGMGIGAIKLWSFMQGNGDYLAELDHDDLLVSTAVEDIENAFASSKADFVYSNAADFFPNGNGHWFPDWEINGWRYRDTIIDERWYNECLSFAPSAASIGLIYYAPNHIRCWRKEFYQKIGGHNPNFRLADDHELVVRTYLHGKIYHLDKLLYLYRMGENNTFSKNIPEIARLTHQIYCNNIEALILREAEIKGLPCYDLGGAFNCPPGWKSVDLHNADINCDLNKSWPFKDNSVLAFRAYDILEHLPNKMHAMSEMSRCLVNGGYAHIAVPHAAGNGAHMDPTHVSYWNEQSFWYYTRTEQAKYIRNKSAHFMEQRLFTHFPSPWHESHNISYVKAELINIKDGREGIPGVKRI